MARAPKHPVQFKLKIVMSALSGESAVADLARRHGVSETSIGNWKQQFLQAGRQGLDVAARRGPSSRELELEREVQTLTQVVGELHVKLRVSEHGGPHGLGFR